MLTNTNEVPQNILCMYFGIIWFMYVFSGMKKQGGDSPDWQVVLLNGVSAGQFT